MCDWIKKKINGNLMWILRMINCMYFEMFVFFIFLVELVVIFEVNWMFFVYFCGIKYGGILFLV